MYYQDHKQLSLIAEDDVEYDYCDWSIDTNPSPELQRSIEAVREYFDGGQIKNRPLNSALHDGGQIKNSSPNSALHDGGQPQTRILSMEGSGGQPPPNSALHDGGQIKNSIFDRSRGEDGTWVEKQNRKTGIFEYLRWRDLDGTKRAKYLGKVA
jgi:hypothetical protein